MSIEYLDVLPTQLPCDLEASPDCGYRESDPREPIVIAGWGGHRDRHKFPAFLIDADRPFTCPVLDSDDRSKAAMLRKISSKSVDDNVHSAEHVERPGNVKQNRRFFFESGGFHCCLTLRRVSCRCERQCLRPRSSARRQRTSSPSLGTATDGIHRLSDVIP